MRKSKGHWRRGHRRNEIDGSRFVSACCRSYSVAKVARAAGVSSRTVRRWASGEDWMPLFRCQSIIDALLPLSTGWHPRYRRDMAIDGNTRVGGVGDYSRRAAQGRLCYSTFLRSKL